jgi:hypothetical protein
MTHSKKALSIIGLMICSLWWVACGSPTPSATPTIDLDPFRTEVAATVLAQVTQAAALAPSATSIPSPTATEQPSATPTAAITATLSLTATQTTGTPGSGTADLVEWVSQTIPDDTIFEPGETFTMTWQLKNAGTSTWSAFYMLRFFSGSSFGAPDEIPLGQEVLPGETVAITLQMEAPDTPGTYRSDWVMATESRFNFKEPIYLKIVVPAPVTATPRP